MPDVYCTYLSLRAPPPVGGRSGATRAVRPDPVQPGAAVQCGAHAHSRRLRFFGCRGRRCQALELGGPLGKCTPCLKIRIFRFAALPLPPYLQSISAQVVLFRTGMYSSYLFDKTYINRYELVWHGRSLAEHFPGLFANQRP